jgi:hypothetical protein
MRAGSILVSVEVACQKPEVEVPMRAAENVRIVESLPEGPVLALSEGETHSSASDAQVTIGEAVTGDFEANSAALDQLEGLFNEMLAEMEPEERARRVRAALDVRVRRPKASER